MSDLDRKLDDAIRNQEASLGLRSSSSQSAGRLVRQMDQSPTRLATTNNWPDALHGDALHGLAGEIVHTIEPHSEADPVALLIQILIAFGNVINRGPHFVAEADRHYSNLFTVLVGETSKGRKGTSWGHVRRLFQGIDPEWEQNNIANGLSSGEGLIWRVRDPITNCGANGVIKVIDDGVADKRLLVMESEFASVLRVMSREKNTLSAVIRNAWDGSALGTLTKNSPTEATDVHISIVGHVTRDELLRYLTETEAGNGFGNRFLWLWVRRSKVLPEGGNLQESALLPLVERLREAVAFSKTVHELRRDDAAREIWAAVYPDLSEGKPGLLGAMISRAEAQVMRLACLYAVLDLSNTVRPEHLSAALALWNFAEASARSIFGQRSGNPVADKITLALREGEMTRTDISGLFGRHVGASQIADALELLRHDGKAHSWRESTGGRDREWWSAVS